MKALYFRTERQILGTMNNSKPSEAPQFSKHFWRADSPAFSEPNSVVFFLGPDGSIFRSRMTSIFGVDAQFFGDGVDFLEPMTSNFRVRWCRIFRAGWRRILRVGWHRIFETGWRRIFEAGWRRIFEGG